MFGYSFHDFPEDIPYEPAPASPVGPPLLNDTESNMLDNFLTTINTNPFSNDFWFPASQNDTNGTFLSGFDWSNELPPTFEGSTSSLPPLHPPSFSHRSVEKSFGNMPEQPNPEVVSAASMLFQNGMNNSETNSAYGNQPLAFSNVDYLQLNGTGKERQHTGHMPDRRTSVSSRAHISAGYHTTEMFFDVQEPISAERQMTAKVQPLHWGSDSSFMDRGYVAPPDQPDEEQRTKEMMEKLQCLERQSSAANTRPPTPDRRVSHQTIPFESEAINQNSGLRKDYVDSIEDLSHPKKKQRLLVKEEDDEISDGITSKQRTKRSKGSGRRLSTDTVRKSRPSQSSKPRENLTEEQKRSNHIHSEQKRRNLIKQGFDDLCTLVPGLRGGGFSKSAVLTQAADWLEDIITGNEQLKKQLDIMLLSNGRNNLMR
ncbi:basic helix-loop-helix domain-containing protein [Aspergillus mulundensis]|uniref:Putative bHLH transcription factor n=1 Tax=Aspergillus mulundensis TaxID=1810919 RepID=A0A3D8SVV3_9EURO|nr:putative bHLH transcription factor [Aspergillus mulundensis]RDW90404.1 putative bHLH transcription factor [Aspergillus mulundensis]